jgi:hypothetical protein
LKEFQEGIQKKRGSMHILTLGKSAIVPAIFKITVNIPNKTPRALEARGAVWHGYVWEFILFVNDDSTK